jgi:Rieske 2Fe-2S family protein
MSFICPYHGWTYGMDGALLAARLMPKDFPKAEFGLRRLPVEVREGMIFVTLSDSPPDLEPAFEAIGRHVEPYELARAKICHTEEYEVRANWKIVVENARECYHCVCAHPELCRLMPHVAIDSPGQMGEFEREFAAQSALWKEMGLSTGNVPMGPREHHAMRFAFRKGVTTQTMDGQPKAPLLGRLSRPEAGVVACSILPGYWLEVSCDYAMTWRLTPASPGRSLVRVDWYVRGDAREGLDYRPAEVAAFWKTTIEQDWALCERNHEGVTSVGYVPGPFAPGLDPRATLGESGPAHFVAWYLGRLRE